MIYTPPLSLSPSLSLSHKYLTLSLYLEATDSTLFGNLPKDVYIPLKTENVTANYHHWALSPKVSICIYAYCSTCSFPISQKKADLYLNNLMHLVYVVYDIYMHVWILNMYVNLTFCFRIFQRIMI